MTHFTHLAALALVLGATTIADAQTRGRARSRTTSMSPGRAASPLGRGPIRARQSQGDTETSGRRRDDQPRDIFDALLVRPGSMQPRNTGPTPDERWRQRPTRADQDAINRRLERAGRNAQLGTLKIRRTAKHGDFADSDAASRLIRQATRLAERGHYHRVHQRGDIRVVDVYMGQIRVGTHRGRPTDIVRLTIVGDTVVRARPHTESLNEMTRRTLFGGD